MPVLRQHRTRDFTVIPNDLLQDQRLSFRDIGLLAWMLSKPRDWKFTYEGMLSERATDGKSAIQAGVKNLKKTGYLRIEKKRNKGRLAESIWYVYDTPCIENQYVDNLPQLQNAVMDSPCIEKPYMENPPQQKKYGTKEKAVPALEGGPQLPEGIFFDHESGEYRRKGSAWQKH